MASLDTRIPGQQFLLPAVIYKLPVLLPDHLLLVHVMHGQQPLLPKTAQCCHCTAAETSSVALDETVVQKQALLHRLGLSTSHYLKLQVSSGAGQQHTAPGPQVVIQQLLNTACVCLMPDHLAYQWWPAPSAVGHSSAPQQPQNLHEDVAAAEGHPAVPGQVSVRGVSTSSQHTCTGSSNAQSDSAHPILALQDKANGADSRVGSRQLEGASQGAHRASEMAQRASEGASEGARRASEMAERASEGGQEGAQSAPEAAQGASEVHAERQEMQESAPASSNGSNGGPFGCSPMHIQLQVLNSLRRLLTSKLDAIAGSTAEEDWSLSQQPGCSHAACMALGYRAGQKQIAAAALDAVASTAAEVVQRAMAGLSFAPSSPTNLERVRQQIEHCLSHYSC